MGASLAPLRNYGRLNGFDLTRLLRAGNKINIAVKFEGLGQKIIDPKLAPIEKI